MLYEYDHFNKCRGSESKILYQDIFYIITNRSDVRLSMSFSERMYGISFDIYHYLAFRWKETSWRSLHTYISEEIQRCMWNLQPALGQRRDYGRNPLEHERRPVSSGMYIGWIIITNYGGYLYYIFIQDKPLHLSSWNPPISNFYWITEGSKFKIK